MLWIGEAVRMLVGLLLVEEQANKKIYRSSLSKMFLGKGVLKICIKFTEHPCQRI